MRSTLHGLSRPPVAAPSGAVEDREPNGRETRETRETMDPSPGSGGRVVPMVSMLRRGAGPSPARRPPMGRRLRDAAPDTSVPTHSRIVFRAAALALR